MLTFATGLWFLARNAATMNRQAQAIRYFFFSQYFSDGLRITLALLLPSLLFAHYNEFPAGLTVSLGAVCASIADAPGPVRHKRNAMLAGIGFVFGVAVITGYAGGNVWLLGVVIGLFSFSFSLFTVYGNRATLVGTAAVLAMILTMAHPVAPADVWPHAALMLAGGVWYMAVSLLVSRLRPYRAAQQALGECIHQVAKFLTIKARFYSLRTDLDEDYRQLVAQQAIVSEKQDAVRELLFKSRLIVKESTPTGRQLVLTFVDVVDLYEQIMATYYDYALLRKRFGATGILDEVAAIIQAVSAELDHIGFAVQANLPYRKRIDFGRQLTLLKQRIDLVGEEDKASSTLVLRKILINLRTLTNRLNDMLVYFEDEAVNRSAPATESDYDRFVSHQDYDLKILRDNLTFTSTTFRHAIRVMLACLTGFVVANLVDYGHHSYWILLTIVVILKPGFSLTKERNYQRSIGTVVGGLLGAAMLLLVHDKTALFVIMLVLMIGAYSFQRTNYVVMVTLLTPYLLILFDFLGAGFLGIVEERIIDTLIGSGIAFLASYLLFPKWESEHILDFMRAVLHANSHYLQTLADGLAGKPIGTTEYRLARKEVYVSSANLSTAFQRMASEPKSRQRNNTEIHQFVVLNHILSSNIATIASGLSEGPPPLPSEEILRLVRRALAALSESRRKLDPIPATDSLPAPTDAPLPLEGPAKPPGPLVGGGVFAAVALTTDEQLLKEQLQFIQKISTDIGKITDEVLTQPTA